VPTVFRFGAFEADLAAGRLLKHGVRINVRKQSFDVLASLLESPGKVVTRDDLRRKLWPDDVFVDFDNGLNSAIGRLREALGDSAERPLYIETLPRYGYRFIGVSAPAVEPEKPSSPIVRVRYAMGLLMCEGRIEEAIAEMEAALESDPLSMFILGYYSFFLWLNRQYDRAMEQARLVIEMEPSYFGGYWTLAMYCREKGLFDEAIAAHRTAVELTGGSPLMLGWMGLTLGRAGRSAEAREVLEHLRAAAERTYVPPASLAWTYLGLGDMDNTFAWLDRAVDARDPMVFPLQSFPFLDALRADRRYAELLRKLKMKPTPPVAGRLAAT
jgi:DNA-binding winged helix-turn-helix (wHTH) protein